MEFDNSFDVPLPPEEAWKLLLDIKRIAPCMPGAELTEVVDERTYKGKTSVRLGPVSLSFGGTVKFEEIDEANHKCLVLAQGSDTKGRGAASAIVSFRVEPAATGSTVLVHTNLTLSGSVAQYGRGVGIIQVTAGQLINQFANALKTELAQSPSIAPAQDPSEPGAPAPAPSAPPPREPVRPVAKPISGFSLMLQVIWASIKRLFGRG
jgi:carbon monoxide dehydrogenase subunit G